jgi:hypothetical protein
MAMQGMNICYIHAAAKLWIGCTLHVFFVARAVDVDDHTGKKYQKQKYANPSTLVVLAGGFWGRGDASSGESGGRVANEEARQAKKAQKKKVKRCVNQAIIIKSQESRSRAVYSIYGTTRAQSSTSSLSMFKRSHTYSHDIPCPS